MFISLYEFSLSATATVSLLTSIGYVTGCLNRDRQFLDKSYIISRHWMSAAMLLMFGLTFVHRFFQVRMFDNHAGAVITLCFFFAVNHLYAFADISLGNPERLNKKVYLISLAGVLLFTAMLAISCHFFSEKVFIIASFIGTILYFFLMGYMVYDFRHHYNQTKAELSDYYSEDYETHLRWRVRCSTVLTCVNLIAPFVIFMPMGVMAFFNFAAAFAFFYVFICYERYIVIERYCFAAIDEVKEQNLETENSAQEMEPNAPEEAGMQPDEVIRVALEQWVADKKYCQADFNIVDLSRSIGTNRTYLSRYINTTYGMTFRGWIASLRVEEAKRLLETTDINLSDLSDQLGFSSLPSFSRTFSQITGEKPSVYRKAQKE